MRFTGWGGGRKKQPKPPGRYQPEFRTHSASQRTTTSGSVSSKRACCTATRQNPSSVMPNPPTYYLATPSWGFGRVFPTPLFDPLQTHQGCPPHLQPRRALQELYSNHKRGASLASSRALARSLYTMPVSATDRQTSMHGGRTDTTLRQPRRSNARPLPLRAPIVRLAHPAKTLSAPAARRPPEAWQAIRWPRTASSRGLTSSRRKRA